MKRLPFLLIFTVWISSVFSVFLAAESDHLERWIPFPGLSATSDLLAIHRGGGPVVAVGKNGAIVTSFDGRNWTLRDSATTADLTGIAWGAGLHVAVAGRLAPLDSEPEGVIVTSPDGVHWTPHHSDVAFRKIVYGEGKFVAVGLSGIYVSPDGWNWTRTYEGSLEDIAYSNGAFVAVGIETIVRSTDGSTWSFVESYDPIPQDHWVSVAAGHGGFVALRQDGASYITLLESKDGAIMKYALYGRWPYGVHYSRMREEFFAWSDSDFSVYRGYSWERGSENEIAMFDLTMSGEEVIAVGESLSVWRLWRLEKLVSGIGSDDWERRFSSTGWTGAINGIANGGGRTVLVGGEGMLATSSHGGSWEMQDFEGTGVLNDVTYHAGEWVVVGSNGVMVMEPSDWTLADHVAASRSFTAAASGGSNLVAVGPEGTLFAGEDAGSVQAIEMVTEDLHDVVFGEDRFVVVGAAGNILLSVDGGEWGVVGVEWDETLRGVAFGEGIFVAVGEDGGILSSPDGGTWTVQDSGVDYPLESVAYGHGYFVAIPREEPGEGTFDRPVLVSRDGIVWEKRSVERRGAVSAVGVFEGAFLVGGADGMLYSSPLVEISSTERSVVAEGGNYELTVSAAGDWSVSGIPDWVTVEPLEGEGDAVVSIRGAANPGLQDREATFFIGGVSHTLRQSGTGFFVSAAASGRGSVSISPDPEGARVAPGTAVTLTAAAAGESPLHAPFLGWSGVGVQSRAPSLTIEVESDLEATAHFPAPTHLFSAARFKGDVLTGGRMDTMLRSGAGGLWQSSELGESDETWAGMAASDDRVVAVGRVGGVAVTLDGREWQMVWGVSGRGFSDVIFAADTFWAIGRFGSLFRSRDGFSWSAIATGVEADLRSIAYDAAMETFVIVGAAGTILTSVGGDEWTEVESDPAWNIYDVASGPDGFVAVTRGEIFPATPDHEWAALGGQVLRSPDGLSWTALPDRLSRIRLTAASSGNGRYIVAGGTERELVFFVSEDAENWTEVEVPLPTVVTDLIFDGETFVAVGYFGSVLASETGEEWEILHTGIESGHWGVAEAPEGGLVAVGEHGQIHRRLGGSQWERVPTRTSSWFWDVVTGDGVTVAVGDRATILYSMDGWQWEEASVSDMDVRFGGVTYAEGQFVAVGEEGVLLVSDDGANWQEWPEVIEVEEEEIPGKRLPASPMYWDVAYGNGVYVAVGEGMVATRAPDDGLWDGVVFHETRSNPVDGGDPIEEPVSLHAVAYLEDVGFVIAGSSGFLAHSADGTDWEIIETEVKIPWESVTSGDGWFVAVGETVIARSSDGRKWEVENWDREGRIYGGNEEGFLTFTNLYYDAIVTPQGAMAVGRIGFENSFPLPPLVRQHSGDVTVELEGDLVLSAEPGGTGPFAYQWFRDGVELTGETDAVLSLTGADRDALGEYHLVISSDAGEVESAPFFVIVQTNYEAWAKAQFGELADSGIADPGVDVAGNGVENLLAYAVDSAPGSARLFLPVTQVERLEVDGEEGDYLTMSFTRSIGAKGLDYIPEATNDLNDWEPLPGDRVIRITRSGTREFVTVRSDTRLNDADAPSNVFLRLRVNLVDQDRSSN